MAQYLYGKNVVKQLLYDKSDIQKLYLAIKDSQIEQLA